MNPQYWQIPQAKAPLALFDNMREWGSFSPGLSAIQSALDKLDHPESAYRQVLIGGTNGKGSVALNVSVNTPIKSGCFLSPHVADIRERILIDGEAVCDALWREAYLLVNKQVNDSALSYFEWILVLAIVIFKLAEVELAVFEVGVGGREDATNVLQPELSCVVSVGLDHQAILGNSVEAIAMHKIAIGRSGKPFLIPRMLSLYPRIMTELKAQKSKINFHDGKGYATNAELVCILLKLLGYASDSLKWWDPPGRRMIESVADKKWYLDGAHNLPAWQDLAAWLGQQRLRPMPLITNLSQGRDPKPFLQSMADYVESVHVWSFDREINTEYARWQKACSATNLELSPLTRARFSQLQQETCLVTGSLHVVGQALRGLRL